MPKIQLHVVTLQSCYLNQPPYECEFGISNYDFTNQQTKPTGNILFLPEIEVIPITNDKTVEQVNIQNVRLNQS